MQQRKGRFTLEVLVDGEVLLCHCPSTALHPNRDLLNSGKARTLHAPKRGPGKVATETQNLGAAYQAVGINDA